jgi:hypothetical protein
MLYSIIQASMPSVLPCCARPIFWVLCLLLTSASSATEAMFKLEYETAAGKTQVAVRRFSQRSVSSGTGTLQQASGLTSCAGLYCDGRIAADGDRLVSWGLLITAPPSTFPPGHFFIVTWPKLECSDKNMLMTLMAQLCGCWIGTLGCRQQRGGNNPPLPARVAELHTPVCI